MKKDIYWESEEEKNWKKGGKIRRKLLLVSIVCVLGISCAGCMATYQEAVEQSGEQTPGDSGEKYFTTLRTWEENGKTHKIVYANDTKVKYMIVLSMYTYAITPLYNADGTLQVYDGE